jgi:hypothetical protein
MIQRALRLRDTLHRYCKQWKPERGGGEHYNLTKDMLDLQD